VAVKGSIQRSMRIIQHRPWVRTARFLSLLAVSYVAGIYSAHQVQRIIDAEKLAQEKQVAQELVLFSTNANVDRQTIEDLRQLVMTQRAQLAASERFLRVYKELLSGSANNPLGVSFGLFTVSPAAEKGHFTYKLVVQKLSNKEMDFNGSLALSVAGPQEGKSVQLALNQVSSQVTLPSIPLSFKYFQAVEGELQLPAGFVPKSVELVVKASDKTVVQTQLEWPVTLP
jgi:hypothetical protein